MNSRCNTFLRSACTSAVFGPTLFLSGAIAQTAADIELPVITVQQGILGLSTEGDVKTYPGARTVITASDIQASGAKTIEEVLRHVPGVQIFDETGIGILPNIGVRGLNPLRSERAMVLLDGVPIAPGPYTGTGLSLFPITLESVDRIDVVRGGAAVHYGPNNIGGVINIITKGVPDRPSAEIRQKLTLFQRSGNALSDTYVSVGAPIGDSGGAQVEANLVRGAGDRDHSDTRVSNFLTNFYVSPFEQARIRGQVQFYDLSSQLPGALTPGAYRQDPRISQRPFDAVNGRTLRGSLVFEQGFGPDLQLRWTQFGHLLDREFSFGQPFDPGVPTTSVSTSPRAFRVFGSEPQLIWSHALGGLPQTLTVGARYVREEVDFDVFNRSLATDREKPVREWRFGTNGYAAYVSNRFGLFSERLQVTPGVRFESVHTAFADELSGFASENKATEVLPGLTISYQATEGLFLFANTNRSLRPPQVAQVTRGGAVGSEVAQVYEVGSRLNMGGGVDLTVTGFRFNYDNQIEFDRARQLFVNLGETKHQGVEVSARWRPAFLEGLRLGANYTYVDAEQVSGPNAGKRVPFSSEHIGSVTMDYTQGSWRFGTSATFQSMAFSDAANTSKESPNGAIGPIPGFWLWNAKASYALSQTQQSKTEVALAVANILDADYYFRGVDTSPIGRVPGPGRTVTLSLRSSF